MHTREDPPTRKTWTRPARGRHKTRQPSHKSGGAIMVNERRGPGTEQFGDDLSDDVGQFVDSVDDIPQFEDGSERRPGRQPS